MPTPFFGQLLQQIKSETDQYQLITFAGFGEPLMDPEFACKVGIAREMGFETTVLTNGYHLTPELFRQLDALGMQSVRVSFYGMDEASYNSMHHPPRGSFERISQNLEVICGEERSTQILMTLNVVDGLNGTVVQGWIDHWGKRADLVEVWRPHNWVDGHDFRKLTSKKRHSCGRPYTGPLQVQVDGTINMCCFDFDGKLLLGDLKNQSLQDIFSDKAYRDLRQCHDTGNFSGTEYICEGCDQRNVDRGDVMIYNSKYNIEERVEMTSSGYSRLT